MNHTTLRPATACIVYKWHGMHCVLSLLSAIQLLHAHTIWLGTPSPSWSCCWVLPVPALRMRQRRRRELPQRLYIFLSPPSAASVMLSMFRAAVSVAGLALSSATSRSSCALTAPKQPPCQQRTLSRSCLAPRFLLKGLLRCGGWKWKECLQRPCDRGSSCACGCMTHAQVTFSVLNGGSAAKPQQAMIMVKHAATGLAAYAVAKPKGGAYVATVTAAATEKQVGKLVSGPLVADCMKRAGTQSFRRYACKGPPGPNLSGFMPPCVRSLGCTT